MELQSKIQQSLGQDLLIGNVIAIEFTFLRKHILIKFKNEIIFILEYR